MSELPAGDIRPEQLRVGLGAEFTRDIQAEDVLAFARLSGDENPLHVDPDYASTTNYGRPIVHGAFQVALASAMVGMHLPGRRVVLGSVRSRFPAPLYYPCTVQVQAEVVTWLPEGQSGSLRVRIREVATSTLTAEIHLSFGFQDARAPAASPAPRPAANSNEHRERIVVTGASGALGRALSEQLSSRFEVVGFARRVPASAPQQAAVCQLSIDLEGDDWEYQASAALAGRPIYALVHAAWPGAPKGGLLELDVHTVRRQVDFGGLTTVRLARWFAAHAQPEGRLVLIGSTAGTVQPELSLAAYSLGKATLEHAVRLLAPELAARGITINAVVPSFMPLGINHAKPERATLLETARVPAGRLCSVGDVLASIGYFLSREASFVTGQVLPLTGGRL
jgi:NAD(P)-dependent dehydrogenase (short-subunit alcohol dehydrogenase family)/acyl dehydratase